MAVRIRPYAPISKEVWQSGLLRYLGKIEVAEWWPIGSNPITSASFNGSFVQWRGLLPSKQTIEVRFLYDLPIFNVFMGAWSSGLWRRS